ncbi:MAG: hypothetical protein RIT03_1215, partial [Bacteroidota bacterium]
MKKICTLFALSLLGTVQIMTAQTPVKKPFSWEAATVYFLLTDRFQNGNTANDHNYHRTKPTGKLRGFEGGDLRGVIQKIDE